MPSRLLVSKMSPNLAARIPKNPVFYLDLWNPTQQGFLGSLDGNDLWSATVANYRSGDSAGTIKVKGWSSSSTANNQTLVASSDTGTDTSFLHTYIAQTTGRVTISTQNAAGTVNTVSGSTNICDGKKHTIDIVSTGTAWLIYVDGVSETLIVVAGTNTGDWFADITLRDNLTMGAISKTTTGSYAIGEHGYTTIFSAALSAATIATDHAGSRKAAPSNTTNLVGSWDFTEGSGTTAVDSVGGADLTLTGVTWVEGLVDKSVNVLPVTSFGSPTWGSQGRTLNGSSDFLDFGDYTAYDLSTIYSFLLWVKPTNATPASNGVMLSKWDGAGNNREWALYNMTDATFLFQNSVDGAGGASLGSLTSTGVVFVSNTWSFIGVTYNAGAGILYVNGSVSPTTNTLKASTHNGISTLRAGRLGGAGGNYFGGVIGEILIYNRALSALEIQQGYIATRWRYGV